MRRYIITAMLMLCATVLKAQDNVPYTSCNNCWNADTLGNHRVVLTVKGSGPVARAVMNWRRRDEQPEAKRIIVQDAKTGRKVTNVKLVAVTRERGEILFEPLSGAGIYYVYYLPYVNEHASNYPKGMYQKPENTAAAAWLRAAEKQAAVPAAITAYQSVDAFNSFYPMEVPATAAEISALAAAHKGESFLLFPEDRMYPIRMAKDVPLRWIKKGPAAVFNGNAARGENYALQLGVYALHDLKNVQVIFSDLKSSGGTVVKGAAPECINIYGTDYTGKPMVPRVDVQQGRVQALWCVITLPQAIKPGLYSTVARVSAAGTRSKEVKINVRVGTVLLKDGGVGEPAKMTRLGWLNSTLAQENTVIAPYTPLVVKGNAVSMLGRRVVLGSNGMLQQVQTYFTPAMTEYSDKPDDLLARPVRFTFKAGRGREMALAGKSFTFTKKEPGTVAWEAVNAGSGLEMTVNGSLEFDGFINYVVKIKALEDVRLDDIALDIPLRSQYAKYMMGFGHKGGYRPERLDWKWDVANKNQDGGWLGNVNGGLQYSLRDEKYSRPLNTNFYLTKPLLLPQSWGNDNRGGVKIAEKDGAVLVNNYSGARTMKRGEVLYYNFTLLVTPFHTLNTDFQWENRFYHSYKPVDTIRKAGANMVNIHHATAINPTINYPFIEWRAMKAYIDSAHAAGLKVKIYNTVREVSNKAYETFALRSLGDEIYSPGPGKGFSWLQEHVGENYIPAWFVPGIKDAAIINSGMNRWHNYYVEGMNWLTKNVGIDGIYLDDVAFDRVTMKRIKRVMAKDGHPGIIDLHSANQYNKRDGFNNSANLYMEHFPYINRLWFGEYFDYENNSPDFFLTEVSGIPFGLMGEMLEKGGNAWRGMVYGMTSRMPWSDSADPRWLWKAWDDFGMKGTKMLGYWLQDNPVKTDNRDVIATVYKKPGAAMVALASWAPGDRDVKLLIDWKKLGIDAAKATITAPAIKNFQPARSFKPGERIPVEKNKGWLLVIK